MAVKASSARVFHIILLRVVLLRASSKFGAFLCLFNWRKRGGGDRGASLCLFLLLLLVFANHYDQRSVQKGQTLFGGGVKTFQKKRCGGGIWRRQRHNTLKKKIFLLLRAHAICMCAPRCSEVHVLSAVLAVRGQVRCNKRSRVPSMCGVPALILSTATSGGMWRGHAPLLQTQN